MKCQHGNTVQVIVETVSAACWDDGIIMVDCKGKHTPINTWLKKQQGKPIKGNAGGLFNRYHRLHSYLPITGCPKCKAIKIGGGYND